MGNNSWSRSAFADYSTQTNYQSKSADEVFGNRKLTSALDPKNINVRESCDSDEHPESLALIFGLDVTGSMGKYAHEIAVTHLPKLMNDILENNVIKDPHLMFMGIDDVHAYSHAPLQASQFESDIRILEQLRDMYMVGGGGGNGSESYDLAWYFAAKKTKIDCFDKRGIPGFIFTFGDEPAPFKTNTKFHLESVFGRGEYYDTTPSEALSLAQERYHVFHVIIEQSDNCNYVKATWSEMLGNNVIFLKDTKFLSDVVVATIRIAQGDAFEKVLSDSSNPDIIRHAFRNMLESSK